MEKLSKNSLQDSLLNALRKEKTAVIIFLVNGIKLQGIITGFDLFVIALKKETVTQLVYKHAISTVLPTEPVLSWKEAD